MKSLFYILQKEFRIIFRNPAILRLIMIMPIMQLIIIPFAADYEVKNINFTVVDLDKSSYSNRLIHKMEGSAYFNLVSYVASESDALDVVSRSETDIIISIPSQFEKNIIAGDGATIFISADAVNGMKAGLGMAYTQQIIRQFNQEIRSEWMPVIPKGEIPMIEILTSSWYNPSSNYRWFMVPGILAILVTMVGCFLAALNIVSEKENGTIEQINVSPIKKYQFILGKLIPFWVLGLVSIIIGIITGIIVYGLYPVGSVISILIYSAIYLFAVLGVGLLISTVAETQQQATLIAFFAMMVFILMGGLYTPVESMPDWAIWVSKFNPPTYFIRGIRSIYLTGSSLWDLKNDIAITIGFAVFFNGLAVLNYRKSS